MAITKWPGALEYSKMLQEQLKQQQQTISPAARVATTPVPATLPPASTPAGVPQTADYLSQLVERMAAPQTGAYEAAQRAYEAQIPLIQQRYKTLLSELEKKTAEEEKATIGETRARAGAMGVYPGTTELGTEQLVRERAGEVVRMGRERYAGAQAEEEMGIQTAIANLGVSRAEAETSGLRSALQSILDIRKEEREQAKLPYEIEALRAKTAGGEGLGLMDLFEIDPATGQLKLRELGQEAPTGPMLISPDGTTYTYDSVNDPDYIQDKARGWKSPWVLEGGETPTPTPTPTPTTRRPVQYIG